MDPVVWFFVLGLVAGLARSDLRLPAAVYDLLSVVLLLTIGLKGGVELAKSPLAGILPQMLSVLAFGFIVPLFLYPVARAVGRLARPDAASLAAHYGSVSVATYAVGVSFLTGLDVPFDTQLPVFLVMLEVPALIVGVLLARGLAGDTAWGKLTHEVMLGKSIVLLVGGLAIGWAAGPEGLKPLEPFFFDLFKGVLALFLLEMGLIAASQAAVLRRHGLFLIAFGLTVPVPMAAAGAVLGWLIGLSPGGALLLAVLAGSASYIAAPAAMRTAVPDANPSLPLATSLGVTFPFNIFVGIPLYYFLVQRIYEFGG
jgi:hypothetical protein